MSQVVLSREDFSKLTDLVRSKNDVQVKAHEKKMKLKMNEEKLNKWGLTAEQIRNRKQEEHFNKFERQEKLQRALEEEHNALVEDEKNQVRDRAREVKIQDSERVRELNSALQLSKVLKEREIQGEILDAKKEYET